MFSSFSRARQLIGDGQIGRRLLNGHQKQNDELLREKMLGIPNLDALTRVKNGLMASIGAVDNTATVYPMHAGSGNVLLPCGLHKSPLQKPL